MSRNGDGSFGGVGLLRRGGVDMCYMTLASLASDRHEAMRRIRTRVEAWLTEWQSRAAS